MLEDCSTLQLCNVLQLLRQELVFSLKAAIALLLSFEVQSDCISLLGNSSGGFEVLLIQMP